MNFFPGHFSIFSFFFASFHLGIVRIMLKYYSQTFFVLYLKKAIALLSSPKRSHMPCHRWCKVEKSTYSNFVLELPWNQGLLIHVHEVCTYMFVTFTYASSYVNCESMRKASNSAQAKYTDVMSSTSSFFFSSSRSSDSL